MQAPSWRTKSRAFTLLEVLLALFIFSMAVVSLVEAVNGTGRATLLARRERQLAVRLESLLTQATRLPHEQKSGGAHVVTQSTLTEDDVTFVIRSEPLDLSNAGGQRLRDIFQVSVTARWKEGSTMQEARMDTWVYRPLFQTQLKTPPSDGSR